VKFTLVVNSMALSLLGLGTGGVPGHDGLEVLVDALSTYNVPHGILLVAWQLGF
jgi:hypothetical protein